MKRLLSIPALLVCAIAQSQGLYHVTDLGTLGGSKSWGQAVNVYGQVAGYSYTAGGSLMFAFLYSNGSLQNLGTLPGGFYSQAFGINASGQVVGIASGTNIQHAFLYDHGNMQDLGVLGTGTLSAAFGINDSGTIVGSSYSNGNSEGRAFSFSNGVMNDLGTLSNNPNTNSQANAINAAGLIVGESDSYSGATQNAVAYANGLVQNIGGFPGFTESLATGVNSAGTIVGYSDGTNSGPFAFEYSGGTFRNLGTLYGLYSFATGINASGQVVGFVGPNNGTGFYGFIYQDGQMLNLNALLDSSGSTLIVKAANGISDNGYIVGYGINASTGANTHALLLTPIAPNVVLPDSYSLLEGTQSDGSLYSLQFNDSWYLTVLSGFPALLSQPPVQVQLSGASPTLNPTSFQFTLTGHVNSINLAQSILLYNFNSNSYETLNTSSAHVGSDSTVTVTPTGDLSRFVNPMNGEVRAQVNFNRTGATPVLRWTASLGVANWIIQ